MTLRYQHSICIVLLGVLPSFAAACSNSKTRTRNAEESVASTSSVSRPAGTSSSSSKANDAPSCGNEIHRYGQGYDDEARACLLDAFNAGRPSSFTLTRYTIEGDPLIITIHVRSRSSVEVIEDNRDRFGAQGVHTSTCSSIERGPVTNGHSGFIVRGCLENPEPLVIR